MIYLVNYNMKSEWLIDIVISSNQRHSLPLVSTGILKKLKTTVIEQNTSDNYCARSKIREVICKILNRAFHRKF